MMMLRTSGVVCACVSLLLTGLVPVSQEVGAIASNGHNKAGENNGSAVTDETGTVEDTSQVLQSWMVVM
eukprot:393856-Amphidinium_carterae.1